MKSPKVSVLIPAHNAELTVESAMSSMLGQTFSDFEIVVVDDGSTDSTALIFDSIAARDVRVRVIHTSKHGIIEALNTGIAECRGELIARMDADDISHPRRLETQVALMDARPDVSVCGTLVKMFPRHELLGGLVRYEHWLNSLVTSDQIARDIFVESPLAHPSVIMRRDELIAIGAYQDHGWAEDYDLWLRYFVAGKRFAKVDAPLVFWRQSECRLTFTDSRYCVENFLRAKAHYLSIGLVGVVPTQMAAHSLLPSPINRNIILWGAGKTGRRLSKHLLREGVNFEAVVDIDPAKIGHLLKGRPIVGLDYIQANPNVFVIAAVGSSVARELIRAKLREFGLEESRAFICAA